MAAGIDRWNSSAKCRDLACGHGRSEGTLHGETRLPSAWRGLRASMMTRGKAESENDNSSWQGNGLQFT